MSHVKISTIIISLVSALLIVIGLVLMATGHPVISLSITIIGLMPWINMCRKKTLRLT